MHEPHGPLPLVAAFALSALAAGAGCGRPFSAAAECAPACGGADASSSGAVGGGGAAGATSSGAGGEGGGPPVAELFVDPVEGSDAGPGTEEEPFRTLKKALSIAGSGQTVHLFEGVYGVDNNDDFEAMVPDGVMIAAVVPGKAVLAGTAGKTGLRFEGGGAAWGLRIEGFATGVIATAGALTLEGLELAENGAGIEIAGAATAQLLDSSIVGGLSGVVIGDVAKLWVIGGEIREVGQPCGSFSAVSVRDAAQLAADGVFILDSPGSISLSDAAIVTITQGTVAGVGSAGCGAQAAILVAGLADLQLADSTVEAVPGWAIRIVGAEGNAGVVGGSITGGSLGGISGYGALSVEGTVLTGLGDPSSCGICAGFGSVSVKDSKVELFGRGIEIDSGGQVSIRGTQLSGNRIAVHMDAGGFLDMGTSFDAGENTLLANAQTSLDIAVASSVVVQAVGNTWLPGNQGTDASGHFPLGTTAAGPFGVNAPAPRNVVIQNAGPVVKLAPDIVP